MEAVRVTEEHLHDREAWPEWIRRKLSVTSLSPKKKTLFMNTEQGNFTVKEDDWIILDDRGRIIPCRPLNVD